MRNRLPLFASLMLLAGSLLSCGGNTYTEVVQRSDSYSLLLYDLDGEHPLLVDSGAIVPGHELHTLVHETPGGETDCTPNALIRLYAAGKPREEMQVYLDGSCTSLAYFAGDAKMEYGLVEENISFITQHKYPAVKELLWLEGTWRTPDTLPFMEEWTVVNSQLLKGQGIQIVREPQLMVRPLEQLELTYKNGEVAYVANVNDQNNGEPVAFVLERPVTEDSFSFTNPAHDFPQRITYKRMAGDTIEVTVGEYQPGGKEFKMTLIRTDEKPEDVVAKLASES